MKTLRISVRRFVRWLNRSSRKHQAADRWAAHGAGLRLAIAVGLSERGWKMVDRYKRHAHRWSRMQGNKLLTGSMLLLMLLGCSPKPKPSVPAPPPIAAKPARRHLTAQAGDLVIHNCIVTRDGKNSADCLCRHASTKIDSVSGAHSLECREGAK